MNSCQTSRRFRSTFFRQLFESQVNKRFNILALGYIAFNFDITELCFAFDYFSRTLSFMERN